MPRANAHIRNLGKGAYGASVALALPYPLPVSDVTSLTPNTTGAAKSAPRIDTGEAGAEPTPGRPRPGETAGAVSPDALISDPTNRDIRRAYEPNRRRMRRNLRLIGVTARGAQ